MLTPLPRTPAQSLDLAFRRQKPTRAQLDEFQLARQHLLASINPAESEEHLKGLLVDFLRHPGVLGPGHYLNVRKRRDLVIRTGPRRARARRLTGYLAPCYLLNYLLTLTSHLSLSLLF